MTATETKNNNSIIMAGLLMAFLFIGFAPIDSAQANPGCFELNNCQNEADVPTASDGFLAGSFEFCAPSYSSAGQIAACQSYVTSRYQAALIMANSSSAASRAYGEAELATLHSYNLGTAHVPGQDPGNNGTTVPDVPASPSGNGGSGGGGGDGTNMYEY